MIVLSTHYIINYLFTLKILINNKHVDMWITHNNWICKVKSNLFLLIKC